MTKEQAWQELLDLVAKGVEAQKAPGLARLQWSRPNRLILMGQWSVEARLVVEPERFSIYFERFGADLGDQNFELPSGAGKVKTKAWTMLLEISNGEAFWRFSDGQTLKSEELARRVITRLREFQVEYAQSVLTPEY